MSLILPKRRLLKPTRRAFLRGLIAAPFVAKSALASNLIPLVGAGSNSLSSGGPPPPYVAKAVHFDGAAYLSTASIAATDNGKLSYFGFFKTSYVVEQDTCIFVVDPSGDFFNGGCGTWSAPYNDPLVLHGGFEIYAAKNNGMNFINNVSTDLPAFDGVWHSVLASLDAQSSLVTIYIDDVQTGNSPSIVGGPFNPDINGKPFYVGNDLANPVGWNGDMSMLWIAPGVSLLDGSGNIPTITRRIFTNASNKPVDPSGFPASACLFNGDATGFSTNQGTGGAFTLTGTLTNASTSPSD